ncbi:MULTISPECIES: hypothetical protein [unclassified Microbacterium]|uniref:hypothetical protein n=1 Tax=unclassified Microbacterium TaxID=2609290 RepID=UPI00097F03E8|nr:hypothetical protein [Microbacterium sp. JB110]SJM63000.1 hypothetical protein CZ774_11715 [Frigoribacterium sp. JB110]
MAGSLVSPRAAAVLWSAVGGAAALVTAPGLIWLLRDRLHVRCSTGAPGTEGYGTWVCADGIGYILPGIAVGGGVMMLVVVAMIISGVVSRDRVRAVLLVVFAGAAMAWGNILIAYGSANLVHGRAAGISGIETWFDAMGVAVLCQAVSLASAIASFFVGARAARIAAWVAVVLACLGAVVQPGLAVTAAPGAFLLMGAACQPPMRDSVVGRRGGEHTPG